MQENRTKLPEINDWEGATKFVADLVKSNESLASETISHSARHARNWLIAFLITLAALFATNAYWIYTFQSYDFVSQDGAGVNSINTGNQEDIDYGAESQTEKGQE